jgi:hypothetical protein
MSEMGLHDPFGWLKHKLWGRERPRVKPTIKSQESPWPPCVQVAWHIPLESSQWGLQIFLNLTSIRGFHTKLWASKVMELSILGILRFPLGGHETKWHLSAGPMAKHRVYYKGEGGGFPKSRPWWILSIRVYSWFVHAPKLFQLCANQFVVWFVWFVWVIDLLVILSGPYPEALACPSTPKVLRARECTH